MKPDEIKVSFCCCFCHRLSSTHSRRSHQLNVDSCYSFLGFGSDGGQLTLLYCLRAQAVPIHRFTNHRWIHFSLSRSSSSKPKHLMGVSYLFVPISFAHGEYDRFELDGTDELTQTLWKSRERSRFFKLELTLPRVRLIRFVRWISHSIQHVLIWNTQILLQVGILPFNFSIKSCCHHPSTHSIDFSFTNSNSAHPNNIYVDPFSTFNVYSTSPLEVYILPQFTSAHSSHHIYLSAKQHVDYLLLLWISYFALIEPWPMHKKLNWKLNEKGEGEWVEEWKNPQNDVSTMCTFLSIGFILNKFQSIFHCKWVERNE